MTESKQTGQTPASQRFDFGLPVPKLDGSIPEAVRPFFEAGLKAQSQLLELCGHRVRAWFDWPEKFFACKTIDDLTTAQSDYFVRMQRDYAAFVDGVLRSAIIEQEELEEGVEEESEGETPSEKTETLHREAA